MLLEGATGLVAAERLARPSPALLQAIEEAGVDRAQSIIDLYEQHSGLQQERRVAGVFYTPPSIVEAMLDRLPARGLWLDPAAGAGVFLVAFAKRHGRAGLERLHACDIDAGALDAAALALEAVLGAEARNDVEHWRHSNARTVDFLRTECGVTPDVIVGNPPYGITDDDWLATRFPALRGERDLYACFLLRALEVLRPGGMVSLLVPDTWLTNTRAVGLRATLAMTGLAAIVDFGKPFATARDTRVHAVTAQSGASECRVESTREGKLLPMAPVSQSSLVERSSQGWFLYRTSSESQACRVIERGQRLGDLFEVVYGLRTGDNANHIGAGKGAIPLIGGRDLDAYDRRVEPKHLLHPEQFGAVLKRQRGQRKLGVQRIRTNSKLPWRRWLEAASLTKAEVGLDSLTLLMSRGDDDALWALLGVLNSSILNRWYRLTFTDVNVKPAYLAELPLPPLSKELADLVRERVRRKGDLQLERAIDRLVIEAYGLKADEARCLEEGFWGDRMHEVPLPSAEECRKITVAR